jgi:hypothetical protein
MLDSLNIFVDNNDKKSYRDAMKRPTTDIAPGRAAMEASCGCTSTVSQQMVVHSLSCSMISRLSTICLSTVSPSPLTAVAPHQSPDDSSPYGSRKLGVTNKYISLGFISISISHSVKRSQKSMNMSATNDYEGRNSPRPLYENSREVRSTIIPPKIRDRIMAPA